MPSGRSLLERKVKRSVTHRVSQQLRIQTMAAAMASHVSTARSPALSFSSSSSSFFPGTTLRRFSAVSLHSPALPRLRVSCQASSVTSPSSTSDAKGLGFRLPFHCFGNLPKDENLFMKFVLATILSFIFFF